MDLSGTETCMICALVMLGDQPKMELLCAHVFHTECVLVEWYSHEMTCPTCHMNIFNDQVRTVSRSNDQESLQKREKTFLEEFAQNKSLKKDIQTIKKQVSKLRKAKATFCKFGNQKRHEWKQEIHPMIQLMRIKQKDMLRKIQGSPDLKAWKTERNTLTRLIHRFETNYTQYRFNSLLEYTSLKLPSRYDYIQLHSIYRWTVRRFFRFRM
jgi:hypothetical protein